MRKINCQKQREKRRRKIKMTRTQRRRRGEGWGRGGTRHRKDRLFKMFPRSKHAITLMFVETLIFLLMRENTNTKYL